MENVVVLRALAPKAAGRRHGRGRTSLSGGDLPGHAVRKILNWLAALAITDDFVLELVACGKTAYHRYPVWGCSAPTGGRKPWPRPNVSNARSLENMDFDRV